MKYVVDTDYVASYLLSRPDAVALLDRLSADGLSISLITLGEIFEGIYYGRNPEKSTATLRQFLRLVDVLPLNRAIIQRFARIRGELRRKGLIIGDFDILIASTAIERNLTLVTRNLRHYERIPSLLIYKPN